MVNKSKVKIVKIKHKIVQKDNKRLKNNSKHQLTSKVYK